MAILITYNPAAHNRRAAINVKTRNKAPIVIKAGTTEITLDQAQVIIANGYIESLIAKKIITITGMPEIKPETNNSSSSGSESTTKSSSEVSKSTAPPKPPKTVEISSTVTPEATNK